MQEMARMSHEKRETAILNAAMRVFSENGFAKTSIKDIAKAADMSPALLYAYFDSKADLYERVLNYTAESTSTTIQEMRRLGPGAAALTFFVFDTLSSTLLEYNPEEAEKKQMFDRLFCQSLVDNPDYAKAHHAELERHLITDFMLSSFEVAEQAGDMFPCKDSPRIRMQMIIHVMLSLKLTHLSGKPVYDYGMSNSELLEKAALFCLRGLGLKPEAIEKYFNARELERTIRRIHAREALGLELEA